MTYQELTIHQKIKMIMYKTYVITQECADGYYFSWRAESNDREDVTYAPSYADLIEWIDFKWDGKDPEGYFQKY